MLFEYYPGQFVNGELRVCSKLEAFTPHSTAIDQVLPEVSNGFKYEVVYIGVFISGLSC